MKLLHKVHETSVFFCELLDVVNVKKTFFAWVNKKKKCKFKQID